VLTRKGKEKRKVAERIQNPEEDRFPRGPPFISIRLRKEEKKDLGREKSISEGQDLPAPLLRCQEKESSRKTITGNEKEDYEKRGLL